jgi:hypothetical protein
MELKVTLQVTAKEVFEELLHSIIFDIENSTKKTIVIDELHKNFTYNKTLINRLGNKVQAKVYITELIFEKKYSAAFETSKGTNTVEYILKNIDCGVEITYRENFTSSFSLQNWNYLFAAFVYKKRTKKKIIKNFNLLEKHILSSKKNVS